MCKEFCGAIAEFIKNGHKNRNSYDIMVAKLAGAGRTKLAPTTDALIVEYDDTTPEILDANDAPIDLVRLSRALRAAV